jgi:hypothetical protein
MKSTEKLKNAMLAGKVYRRKELAGFSTAVDRDLKTLVTAGEVQRLAGGLYYRPRTNPFGVTPPEDREIARAFLKTDDFLLTSYNYFNQLGLGLTQVYNHYMVYNHKRSGSFLLGGKQFKFRLVPAYPHELSKEFLLVDLLNNLKHLADNTDLVMRNLKSRLGDFDRQAVREQLARYGRAATHAALEEAYAPVHP